MDCTSYFIPVQFSDDLDLDQCTFVFVKRSTLIQDAIIAAQLSDIFNYGPIQVRILPLPLTDITLHLSANLQGPFDRRGYPWTLEDLMHISRLLSKRLCKFVCRRYRTLEPNYRVVCGAERGVCGV